MVNDVFSEIGYGSIQCSNLKYARILKRQVCPPDRQKLDFGVVRIHLAVAGVYPNGAIYRMNSLRCYVFVSILCADRTRMSRLNTISRLMR